MVAKPGEAGPAVLGESNAMWCMVVEVELYLEYGGRRHSA